MNKLISIAVCMVLLFPMLTFCQPKQYPDSIRVELPDHGAFIVFELRRYVDDKDLISNFPARLATLLDQVEKSIPANQHKQPHLISAIKETAKDKVNQYMIRITSPTHGETQLSVVNNEIVQLVPPGWEIRIKDDKADIFVYATDLEKLRLLATTDFMPVISQIDSNKDIFHHKRMGTIARVIVSSGSATIAKTSHRYPGDMIGFHAGAGVGLLNEKWYPEANFSTALYFSSRFKQFRSRVMANYEIKLFSDNREGEFRLTPASFVSLSYGLNFSKDNPRWTALGVGYLVHNKSELFKGNTLKLFLETDIGSQKLNIVPELYLTDDFKRTLFGIKLNYKF